VSSRRHGKAPVDQPFVSTGRLPSPELVETLVAGCYESLKGNRDGRNSEVYPALARVPPDLFGLCVVGVKGSVYAIGDWDCPFSIMSVSKPLESNSRNRAIGQLLHNYGRIALEPAEAIELYTRQCSLSVTARDLAVMGATLADGGVNPLTKMRVIDAESCKYTLAVMATAGLYEASGDWLYQVGLPGKSGIGGGIVTVSPGKGGLGSFAPRLDDAGNSVKGRLAARYLSERLGLSLFASKAET
jgi:glutaminase